MSDVEELLGRLDLTGYGRILSDVVRRGYWKGHKVGSDEVGFVFEEQDEYTMDALENRIIELSEKTQSKLIGDLKQTLREGLSERKSIAEIGGKVGEVFDGLRTWETERVVRTEVMTAVNTGRNDAWMKSRVVEWKCWWNAAIGNKRTAEDSKRMYGQIVKVEEQFVDPMDGSRYMMPPNRPNCRCTARPLRNLPEDVVWIGGQMYDGKMARKESKVYQ